jgi:hypothetical protein
MELQPTLSAEELACFRELFVPTELSVNPNNPTYNLSHNLSIATEIPQVLAAILGKSTLTLLAEIDHYKLWFPISLHTDELGQFLPSLGMPEVLDTQGGERSWRLDNNKGIHLLDEQTAMAIEVLSLSSSGLSIKLPDNWEYLDNSVSRMGTLQLSDGNEMAIEFEPIGQRNGILGAKMLLKSPQQRVLREFLFAKHKLKYQHLYSTS